MSTLKTALKTSATSIVNTVPLITTTVETAAVVANSWLAELVNEDAAKAMKNVNTVKQLMLNGGSEATGAAKK